MARQADDYESSKLTPEQQLVVTINEAIAAADVSATAAVNALTMAAIALTVSDAIAFTEALVGKTAVLPPLPRSLH